MDKLLAGKKIAILVESKFIPEEIDAYQIGFALLGAEVEFFSRLYYGDYKPGHPAWKDPVFYSDVDPSDSPPWQSPRLLPVPPGNDVSVLAQQLGDYAAVLVAANYTSVRLRWTDEVPPSSPAGARAYVQSAPVPKLLSQAMQDKHLVKGALCHGLWALTPYPEHLAGRHVTCHTVVMADVLNAGADIQLAQQSGRSVVAPVVTDDDLVTGFSKHEVLPYIEAVAAAIVARP